MSDRFPGQEDQELEKFFALGFLVFMVAWTVLLSSLFLPTNVTATIVSTTSSMDTNGVTWYNVTAVYHTITVSARVKFEVFFVNSTMEIRINYAGKFAGFAPEFPPGCG